MILMTAKGGPLTGSESAWANDVLGLDVQNVGWNVGFRHTN